MLKYVLNKKGIECIGKSKKLKFKNATKIYIIVDNNGIILAVKIYPANKNDSTITKDTIDSMSIKTISSRKFPKYLIGDKGYTSKDVKNRIKKKI